MKATFNDQENEFRIADIAAFEATLDGGSAYALLRKFTEGVWSAANVAHVISFALHGMSPEGSLYWRVRKDAIRAGIHVSARVPYKPHPDVSAVVNKAPGEYAELAASILTEAVFGPEATTEPADG